jgi:hypothetical protein
MPAYVAAYLRLGGSARLLRILGTMIADAIFVLAVVVLYMVPLLVYRAEAAQHPANMFDISMYSIFFAVGMSVAMLPAIRARQSMARIRSWRG